MTRLKRIFSGKPKELWQRASDKLQLAMTDQGSRSVAARAALFTFAVRVVAAALAFGSQVVFARMMGAHDYGVYAIVWVWLQVLALFAALGYPTGVLRFVPELLASNRLGELGTVIIKGPLFNVALCTLIAASGVAILFFFPEWFDSAFVVPLVLAAFCLPMMTLAFDQDGIAQAFNWPVLVSVPGYLVRPTLILLVFVGMDLAGVEASASTAMIATIISLWVVTVGQLLILRRKLLARVGRLTVEGPIRPWLAAALPMFAVQGFFFLIINADIMIAGLFIQPDQVAVYYAAAKTLALVHFVSFAIRVATSHKIAEYHASGNQPALAETLVDTLRWTFWPSLLIIGALYWQGGLLLSLFGEGFESGTAFLAILLVGVLIRATVGPAEMMLSMANAQKTAALVYAAVFAINVGLNFALIPMIGLTGAAIATASSMAIESLLLVIAVKHRLGIISFIGLASRLNSARHGPIVAEPGE